MGAFVAETQELHRKLGLLGKPCKGDRVQAKLEAAASSLQPRMYLERLKDGSGLDPMDPVEAVARCDGSLPSVSRPGQPC